MSRISERTAKTIELVRFFRFVSFFRFTDDAVGLAHAMLCSECDACAPGGRPRQTERNEYRIGGWICDIVAVCTEWLPFSVFAV